MPGRYGKEFEEARLRAGQFETFFMRIFRKLETNFIDSKWLQP
jgi:hypothetical protein